MLGTQCGCPGQRCSVLGCSVLQGMFDARCPHPGCYQDARWGCLVPGGSALGHLVPKGMFPISMPMLCSINLVLGCPMLGVGGSDTGIPDAWCRGGGCPILGTGMLGAWGNARYWHAQRPGGCLVLGCPAPRGMRGTRIPDPRTASTQGDTWYRDAQRRDIQCPGKMPSARGDARLRDACPAAQGAVLTAALEALPTASPDEVPAEVAPSVEPAAPGLEAMPGARCCRRPGLGPRSGAVPAGRADAQRVGSLQAAPARPRLGLQLPQLDQLHGPGRCAARRGGGRAGSGHPAGETEAEPRRGPMERRRLRWLRPAGRAGGGDGEWRGMGGGTGRPRSPQPGAAPLRASVSPPRAALERLRSAPSSVRGQTGPFLPTPPHGNEHRGARPAANDPVLLAGSTRKRKGPAAAASTGAIQSAGGEAKPSSQPCRHGGCTMGNLPAPSPLLQCSCNSTGILPGTLGPHNTQGIEPQC